MLARHRMAPSLGDGELGLDMRLAYRHYSSTKRNVVEKGSQRRSSSYDRQWGSLAHLGWRGVRQGCADGQRRPCPVRYDVGRRTPSGDFFRDITRVWKVPGFVPLFSWDFHTTRFQCPVLVLRLALESRGLRRSLPCQ